MRLVDELAARARRMAVEPLPPPVRTAARTQLTDTVGALLAGHASLHERIDALGAGPAFAGGVYAHCWEVAAIHRESVLLPGVVVLPAVLSALEPGLPFEAVLRALVAGYEVTIAAGLALRSDRLIGAGWWPTALIGPLGGAAALGVLRGEPERVIASAIALAAQQAGGLVAGASVDGRYLLAGQAAARAVDAARTAARGWTGPHDVFDDARSPLRRNPLAGNAMPDFLLPELSLKRHAAAKHLQAAIDAVLAVPGRPRRIEVALPARLAGVVDRPPPFPSDLYALPSAQFTLATAALRGHCTPWDYAARADPELLALARAVRVVPVADDPGWGATVTVHTDDGVHVVARKQSYGDPGDELSDVDLLAKFDILAARSLPEDRTLGRDLRHGQDAHALTALWVVRALLGAAG